MNRWLLRSLLAIVVIAVALVAFVWVRSAVALGSRYVVNEPPLTLPTDAASIARGAHIATLRGCSGECHGADLAGRVLAGVPAMIGRLAGPNLTRGRGGLGATLSVADWERAIRHGVKPDGHPILFMPTRDYAGMSDADTADLIAWARQMRPVDRIAPASRIGPVARVLFAFGKMPGLLGARLINQHASHMTSMAPAPTADYGRYLASSCTGCHGEHLSGGAIPGLPPGFAKPANLTPDRATGLGNWSEADFSRALRTGKRPDGSMIDPFMPWRSFAAMTDTEVAALWAYLRTLPAQPAGGR